MGLTLQFAIGERQTLIDAVKRFDLEFLDDIVSANQLADFSLHITPNDLNFLIYSVTELKQKAQFGLRENLDTTLFYFDSEEAGAYLVDAKIKNLFSELDKNDASAIANKWFNKMSIEYKEEMSCTDETVTSIEQLITICKTANELNLDLVHIWYL